MTHLLLSTSSVSVRIKIAPTVSSHLGEGKPIGIFIFLRKDLIISALGKGLGEDKFMGPSISVWAMI